MLSLPAFLFLNINMCVQIEAREALKKKEEGERIEAELEKHRFRARSWKPPKHFHPKISHKNKNNCPDAARKPTE